MTMKSTIFWDVTPITQKFTDVSEERIIFISSVEEQALHTSSKKRKEFLLAVMVNFRILNMEAVSSFEMS
jgi:hypothetical protein